jgi:protoheme IX farnesyltransferase
MLPRPFICAVCQQAALRIPARLLPTTFRRDYINPIQANGPEKFRRRRVSSTASFFNSNFSLSTAQLNAHTRPVASVLEYQDIDMRPVVKDVQFKQSLQSDLIYPPPNAIYRPNTPMTITRLLKTYTSLSKSRLTALIVLTTMSGYALSPLPGSVSILLSTALGTTLCSASANAFNQLQEAPYDAQMVRTRGRPLIRRSITPLHAFGFAVTSGVAGVGILWNFVNPLTAILGATNIVLYAGVYTYLKRKHIVNTWVGAVVGGIPPLMGFTACGGSLLPSLTAPIILFLPSFDPSTIFPAPIDNPLAPWALFMLLFSWQFPHFNSLSLITASSYARAGFRMLSVISPKRNAGVALRHALILLPVCSVFAPLSGLTTWWFALSSLLPNLIAIRAAWRFWATNGGLSESAARAVWRTSLWWLPVVLGLMMVHKKDADWGFYFRRTEPTQPRRADTSSLSA